MRKPTTAATGPMVYAVDEANTTNENAYKRKRLPDVRIIEGRNSPGHIADPTARAVRRQFRIIQGDLFD